MVERGPEHKKHRQAKSEPLLASESKRGKKSKNPEKKGG